MSVSKKHHYIPQFFIKGFTDNEGIFWVYDKLYDQIIPKPQTSAMRFYLKSRNTITVDGNEFDFLEKSYQFLEDKIKNAITFSRSADNLDGLCNVENIGYLLMFIVSTFWRVPQNDELNKSLLEYYKHNRKGWDIFSQLNLIEGLFPWRF